MIAGNIFGRAGLKTQHMRGLEFHFGVIREKQAIHAALLQSKSLNRQLAVCYNIDGKLIVKICTVVAMEVPEGKEGGNVTLSCMDGEALSEFEVPLTSIQSLYPIRDFKLEEPEPTGDVNWPQDPEPH